MSKTKAQLIENALIELGALAEGASVTAADSVRVGDAYVSLLRLLEVKNLAWWPEDEIPEEVYTPMSKLLADRIKKQYGFDNYDPDTALDDLIILSAKPSKREPVNSEYF